TAVLVLPAVARSQSSDGYLCYQAHASRERTRFPGRAALPVADRFGARATDLTKPRQVCTPAGIDGGGIGDAATHLTTYQLKNVIPLPPPQTGLRLAMAIGTLTVDLAKPVLATAPAATDPAAEPPPPEPAGPDV